MISSHDTGYIGPASGSPHQASSPHTPQPLGSLFQQAHALWEHQQYKEAIETFTHLLNDHEEGGDDDAVRSQAYTHLYRGLCREQLGELDVAINDFTAALELIPDFQRAAYCRAKCRSLQGKTAEAIEDYERALHGEDASPADVPMPSPLTSTWWGTSNKRRSRFAARQLQLQQQQQHRVDVVEHDVKSSSAYPTLCDAAPLAGIGSSLSRQAVPLELAREEGSAGAMLLAEDASSEDGLVDASCRGAFPAQSYYELGLLHRRSGDYVQAVEMYTRAVEMQPHHFRSWFNRGFCLDRLHRFEEAVESYARAMELDPFNPFAYYNAGIALDHSQRYDAAVAIFTKAIEINATVADFFHNRGFSRRKLGDFRGAVTDYTEALQLDPQHFKSYYNRAYSLDKLGQYRDAVKDYTSALALEPGNSNAYHNRAASHLRQGELHRALDDFSTAVKLDPTSISSLHARGLVYDELQLYTDAIADYTRAMSLPASRSATAILAQHRGDAHRGLEQHEAALADYDDAIARTERPDAALLHSRAFVLRRLGRLEEAVADYTSSLALLTDVAGQCGVLCSRAYCLAHLRQREQAVADYTRAITLDGSQVHALNNRGLLHDQERNWAAAVADFTTILRLTSDPHLRASAHYMRGLTYARSGNREGASHDFTRAVELDTTADSIITSAQEQREAMERHPAWIALQQLKTSRR